MRNWSLQNRYFERCHRRTRVRPHRAGCGKGGFVAGDWRGGVLFLCRSRAGCSPTNARNRLLACRLPSPRTTRHRTAHEDRLQTPASDGPGQSMRRPQQGRQPRIPAALYDEFPRVALLRVYARRAVPQMNLIEVAAPRQTRPGRRSKQSRAWDKSVERRPKFGAIAILLHHGRLADRNEALSNVTRHYDDLSQASVRLGQPILAPT